MNECECMNWNYFKASHGSYNNNLLSVNQIHVIS